MSVFKHKNGYYGYNFMYKGKRYCRTIKGLSKEEVHVDFWKHYQTN